MSTSQAMLPEGFAALEPYAAQWAGETAAERARLRSTYPAEARDAFYAACRPLLESALAELDAKPLAAHDERERRLMRMMLTFAHVSLAVEVQRGDEPAHAGLREHLRFLHASADAD